ncbi:zinc finger protein 91 [Manduca sexta]|uniref:zinc finger protein 91 n=1 Tax=Manduca sexta TaxID=7130 RepID=UPI0011840D57|nr:zinc finger protein 91 [Manduca sexta]
MANMSSINKILNSIINNQTKFCCLCLDVISPEEEAIHIKDEVVVNVNGSENMLQISEVLKFVLGAKTYQYVNTFDTICDKCTRMTLSSYTFIQTSEQNAEYMARCIEALTNSIEHTTDNVNSKSLYLTLNMEDFTSKQLYDCEQVPKNAKDVLQRFQTVENASKIKLTKELKMKREFKSRKTEFLSMLLDPNNPESIKCKECFNVYPNLWGLKSHYIRVHAPKKFKCPECPCSYGSKPYLDAHIKESHCSIVCSECGKTFKNRHTLKMHEKGHNLAIMCPDCGRVYKNQTTYKKHKEMNVCGRKTRASPSDAKLTCDYCNKKYTQKVSLRVHIQYEHGNYKAHICEWCGKKFWAQSRLKAHIVKHTKERNYSCSICGGKFVTKESLLYHTRTHTGERPYKCSECNCRFLSASRRSEHIKRHHQGATLECDVCHSKFTSVSFLQKHKKTHENDENKVTGGEKPKSDENKISNAKVTLGKEKNEANQYECKNEFYDNSTQSDEDGKVYLEVCEEGEEYILTIDTV